MHAPIAITPDNGITSAPMAVTPSVSIRITAILVALLAIIVPVLVVRFGPHPVPHRAPHLVPTHIVPKTVLPPVEPVTYEAVTPDRARDINASIPFTTDPVPPARPFLLNDDALNAARATDCLAAAELYEAGDDAEGERAVAQVILNRLRHPAFPKTVCGVVFQGSERRTGCQFSFTCDGTMIRFHWRADQWARARVIATAALKGSVFGRVGYATHYHTVEVVPYWSASLDKVAAVGAHLFFRWTGWWGTPGAFRQTVSNSEPAIAMLSDVSAAHRVDGSAFDLMTDEQRTAAVAAEAARMPPMGADGSTFLVAIGKSLPPDQLPRLALQSCGDRAYCKFMAWIDARSVPKRVPIDQAAIASMAFSYLRDLPQGFEKALWNCALFPTVDKKRCMKTQVLTAPDTTPSLPPSPASPSEPAVVPPPASQPLAGVRRAEAAAPTTAATATVSQPPSPKPSPSPKP